MGFELAAMMIGGLYLGQTIDEHYGTNGLAVAGLSLLLLFGWLYHMIVLLRRFQNQDDQVQK